MNTNRLLSALMAPLLLVGSVLPSLANVPRVEGTDVPAPFVSVSGDCRSAGQQLASELGGTLHSASAETQNGQAVCVIVVIVPPASSGEHPQLVRRTVPQ